MGQRIFINPLTATFNELSPVAQALMTGGIVACPTESCYALAALADNHPGLDRIMSMKGELRQNKPMLLLIDQPERVKCYAREVPEEAVKLMERFWPGPLTLLFLAHSGLHPALVGAARTVGLRVEGLAMVRQLIRMVDRGITGTSANVSGEPPAVTADEVENYFGNDVDLIIDIGRPTSGGTPSTIIDSSLSVPRVLREGGAPLNELIATCPSLRFTS